MLNLPGAQARELEVGGGRGGAATPPCPLTGGGRGEEGQRVHLHYKKPASYTYI